MSDSLDRQVVAVDSADDAVANADVVLSATSALQPVIQTSWIRPGMHVGVIKLAEMPRESIGAFDRIVIHSSQATPVVLSARSVVLPGAPSSLGEQAAHSLPDILDLLTGRVAGRENDDQSMAFINNSGLGLQFAAVGAHVYQRAIANGVGRELPTEWFTESVHP